MKIKTIQLISPFGDEALTEMLFEIASARADGAELLRVDLDSRDENSTKLMQFLIRKLKAMKQKGQVQFFASADSFEKSSTEAVFLLNKYPTHFEGISTDKSENYIYVKL